MTVRDTKRYFGVVNFNEWDGNELLPQLITLNPIRAALGMQLFWFSVICYLKVVCSCVKYKVSVWVSRTLGIPERLISLWRWRSSFLFLFFFFWSPFETILKKCLWIWMCVMFNCKIFLLFFRCTSAEASVVLQWTLNLLDFTFKNH